MNVKLLLMNNFCVVLNLTKWFINVTFMMSLNNVGVKRTFASLSNRPPLKLTFSIFGFLSKAEPNIFYFSPK